MIPVAYLGYTSVKNWNWARAFLEGQIYSKPIRSTLIAVATGAAITLALVIAFVTLWRKDLKSEAPNIAKQLEPLPKTAPTPSPTPTAAADTPALTKQAPTKELGRKTETAKPPPALVEPPKVHQPQQPSVNAPYGIAIGGDNKGTATVNNYAPPNRRLTETQISALETVVASLPKEASEYIFVKEVNDVETLRYSSEIASIFKKHKKLKNVLTALSWSSGTPPEGVFLVVRDQNDENFPVAQRIANAMVGSGIQLEFAGAEWAKKGEIWIVIGTRPER